jgi:hypothetical protein
LALGLFLLVAGHGLLALLRGLGLALGLLLLMALACSAVGRPGLLCAAGRAAPVAVAAIACALGQLPPVPARGWC